MAMSDFSLFTEGQTKIGLRCGAPRKASKLKTMLNRAAHDDDGES
jgi:hypothetical protein